MKEMADLDDVIARARGGDEAAFTVLFRRFQPLLLRYLQGVAIASEDLASEVWLDVVRGLSTFSGDEAAAFSVAIQPSVSPTWLVEV